MELFGEIDSFIEKVETILTDGTKGKEIGDLLDITTDATTGDEIPGLTEINNKVLEVRATVGAKQNRVELMESRLQTQEINVTKQMSLNEDTDYAKTITEMVTAESIHQASLSVGAKIIQQTLVDFIR